MSGVQRPGRYVGVMRGSNVWLDADGLALGLNARCDATFSGRSRFPVRAQVALQLNLFQGSSPETSPASC